MAQTLDNLSLNIGVNVTGLNQIQKVQSQVTRLDTSIKAHTKSYNNASVATNKFAKGALQQAGYQIGDYAVQVANGTSAIQAFGQQGSQMLGIFGPVGALLGAGVAIFSAVAVAAEKSGKSFFDFNKFSQDLQPTLSKLRPILDRLGGGLTLLKNTAIAAINGIVNGFQYLVAVVSAVPDAFRAFMNRAGIYLTAFGRDAEAVSLSVQASMQEMMDAITPGEAKGAFLPSFEGEDVGKTAAENLRWMAKNKAAQADLARNIGEDTAGAFDTLGNAIKGVTAIDIRDYFGGVAKAVGGDGGGGGNSLTGALTAAQQRMQDIADTMKETFTSGFMSIIDGTKSLKDAFFSMARSIIAKLFEILVVQRLVGGFDAATGTGTGLVGGIMSLAGARAQGGPITSGRPYLVGERGPEIIVPSRNASVIPNNQLGGGGVTVIQNNTFGSGVSRAEIQSMLPKIVETTKAAVFDAQRRRVNGFA